MPSSIKETLRVFLLEALTVAGVKELTQEDVVLENAPAYTNADYATSVAFAAAKYKGGSPRGVAEELIKALRERLDFGSVLADAQVAGAGFINLYVSHARLEGELGKALGAGDEFGKGDLYQGKKIIIEFTDPNPFKEFHVGHLYSNTVGESLARLIEWQGGEVKRANYQGDVGLHVAKAVWGILYMLKNNLPKESDSIERKVRYLGNAYTIGAGAYDKNDMSGSISGGSTKQELREQIEEINTKIYARSDSEINRVYDLGRRWSLDYFETIYRRLGTEFDFYYFEGDIARKGLEIVDEYKKRGVFEESRGAVVFPGERYGLHTRVFINAKGLPTYEAKELGLAFIKQKDFPFDKSIIITGNEINEYFQVLLKALEQINAELAAKTVHISHGMVRLPQGKMSSRKGNIITGQSLLEEAKTRALSLIESSGGKKEMKIEEKDDVAEKVAVAAVKYVLLKHALGHDIVFFFDEAVTFEGDSGPYLQYTYARTQSVLARSEKSYEDAKSWGELNESELALLRAILRFPEAALFAAEHYAPHSLCTFLFDLAKNFNAFYGANHILGSGKEETKRLALTKAAGTVLQKGLWFLGIRAPKAM